MPEEKIVDKDKSKFSSLLVGISWVNFWLFLIFICSFGDESITNKGSDIIKVETKKEYTLSPELYCSEKGILYFNETYTVVFDEKGKIIVCNRKNSIYKEDDYYTSGYKIIRERNK